MAVSKSRTIINRHCKPQKSQVIPDNITNNQLRYLRSCDLWVRDQDRNLLAYKILASPKQFESIINTMKLQPEVICALLKILTNDNLLQPDVLSEETRKLLNQVYSKVVSSDLILSTQNLSLYINDLFEKEKILLEDIQILRSITDLLEYLLVTFPSEYRNFSSCIRSLHMNCHDNSECHINKLPTHIWTNIDNLYSQFKRIKIEKTPKKETSFPNKHKQWYNIGQYGIPYTQMTILPSHAEIFERNPPKLRHILKQGAYPSAEVYMDVLFKLLREDMLGPLRDGVKHLIAKSECARKELYFYDNVVNLGIKCSSKHGITHYISCEPYGVKYPNNIEWNKTERLKFGSLVCIIPKIKNLPTFETSSWAIVVDRFSTVSTNGFQLSIKFNEHQHQDNFQPNREYFMLESRLVYYEAYSHTLSVLQKTDPEDIPMKEVILGQQTLCPHPDYIDCWGELDLLSGVFPGHNDLTMLGEWPSNSGLLDLSQQNALRLALNSNIALIQGPPGTGKTYVGVHLLNILLKARRKQFQDCRVKSNSALIDSPILVVTYTNHALDQFLSSLLLYEHNIIRIGSRVEQNNLKDITLSKVRENTLKDKHKIPSSISNLRLECGQILHQLRGIESRINEISSELAHMNENTLTEDDIARFATLQQYKSIFAREKDLKYVLDQNKTICDYWLYGNNSMIKQPQFTEILYSDPDFYVNKYFLDENQFRLLTDLDVHSDDEDEILDQDFFLNLRLEHSGIHFSEIEMSLNSDSDSIIDMPLSIQRNEEFGATNEDIYHPVTDESETSLKGEELEEYDETGQKMIQPKFDEKYCNVDNMSLYLEPPDHVINCADPWKLNKHERFSLYYYWLTKKKASLNESMTLYSQNYSELCLSLRDKNLQVDLFLVHQADIIGMTTTGGSINSGLLKQLKPTIIFVEEAAEVLEAQIIACLSSNLKHLILIGDHKQLRPSNAVYELALRYNLNISLFERLLNNGVEHATLKYQHRMRPEISRLVTPIYPSLINHPSVLTRNPIQGISSNIYFIDHSQVEDPTKGDSSSWTNTYEAKFVSNLAIYITNQGYSQQDVTILTFYKGQVFLIKSLLRQIKPKNEIRVCTVDKFQGQESTIILFSVVRSNLQNKIGYCKVDNRVCVALSRARDGFYLIGNANCLRESSKGTKSNLWSQIIDNFNGNIGDSLALYCQKHPQKINYVKTPEDFRNVRNGGCDLECDERMNCGHKCELLCHPFTHERLQCLRPCERKFPCGHSCSTGAVGKQKLCFEDCGECTILVKKKLECGHSSMVACCAKPEQTHCSEPCENILSCGHKCQRVCGDDCSLIQCSISLDFEPICGHRQLIPCFIMDSGDMMAFSCKVECEFILECGHTCPGSCSGCFRNQIHQPCSQRCNKVLVCGHFCQESCHRPYVCGPCKEPCRTRCAHGKCTRICGDMCSYCTETCEWVCPSLKCERMCSEPCLRARCVVKCKFYLSCGHLCMGVCGEPCPQVCFVCHPEDSAFSYCCLRGEVGKNIKLVVLEDCHHQFEVGYLDIRMDENYVECDPIHTRLQLPKCPGCSTPIMKNLRYGRMIKHIQKNIEAAKETIKLRFRSHLHDQCEMLLHEFRTLDNFWHMAKYTETISKLLCHCDSTKLSVLRDILQIFADTMVNTISLGPNEEIVQYLTSIVNTEEYRFEIDAQAISKLKELSERCRIRTMFQLALDANDLSKEDRYNVTSIQSLFERYVSEGDVQQMDHDFLSYCLICLNNLFACYNIELPQVRRIRINRPVEIEASGKKEQAESSIW